LKIFRGRGITWENGSRMSVESFAQETTFSVNGNQRAGIKYANNDNGEAYRKSTTTRCQVSKTDDVEITEWGNCTKESKNGKFVSEGGRMTCQFKNPNRKKDCVQLAQREIALII
jgi:hypothetical protein